MRSVDLVSLDSLSAFVFHVSVFLWFNVTFVSIEREERNMRVYADLIWYPCAQFDDFQ
jgi:hypothetical protein